jgi:NAD dependent epimerase/dehydratase family enzyme
MKVEVWISSSKAGLYLSASEAAMDEKSNAV